MIPLLEPRGRTLRTGRVKLAPQHASDFFPDPLGTLPAHGGLIRTERLTRSVLQFLERESPGRSPEVSG